MAKKQSRSGGSRSTAKRQLGTVSKTSRRKKSAKKSKEWLIWLVLSIAVMAIFSCLTYKQAKPENGSLSVHYIDVGQGDAIYISCGDKNMLIDSGEVSQGDTVCAYLHEQGVETLDYVIGTHPHSDHMGGMAAVVQEFDIGEFIMPHLADEDFPTTKYFERFLNAAEEKELNITEAELGMKVPFGDAQWEVIAPIGEKYSNTNNYSVGIILRYGERSFIFTGDAEKQVEKQILENYPLRHIDVYKAGHHGSDTSSSEEFLEAISPDYAVISCGEGNSYGHPHDVTVEKLEKYTDKIYRTDLCGTVVITTDGDNISVSTERSAA
ncbi:MAG: MBL fold metallo-hydrolase [Alistipes sp.]|nr:MBL fold metallo-hydrolase [Alistipes sp.]